MPPAPWWPLSAKVITPASVRAWSSPWVRAAFRSCTEPGSVGEADTSLPEGSAVDLDVETVSLVFTRVVGPVFGEAVDQDRRAVEDGVGRPPYLGDGRGQGLCGGGEQVDGFADVAPGGGGAGTGPAGRASVGVAVAEVGEYEQGLFAGVRPALPGPGPGPVGADEIGPGG